MTFSKSFRGRIIQVTEALDVADAVSNQIIALDAHFKALGLYSLIATECHHSDLDHARVSLSGFEFTDDDIIVYHYYLFAEHSSSIVSEQYCTKIMVYHNITPATFFKRGSKAEENCRKGREQLRQIAGRFDFFWGVSQFNVDELISLGADPAKCEVVPIVVEPGLTDRRPRKPGSWVSVGRLAGNKRQDEIVRLFASVRDRAPDAAAQLQLIGGYDPADPYVIDLKRLIFKLGLNDLVRLPGKVSDQERNGIFAGSQFNISLSEHEGFGVPLIEAPLLGVPTLALDRAAVSETLGGAGCYSTKEEIGEAVVALCENKAAWSDLLAQQATRGINFSATSVRKRLTEALARIIPMDGQFRKVSVVICTYNRCDHLDRCLDYLKYQSSPDFEVIVVKGPSHDSTDTVLDAHRDWIKVVSNPIRNLSVSRNLGIEAASGDIVAFVDDDALPFDDWVYTILSEYASRPLTFAGLGGPVYYAGTFWFQAQDNGIDNNCQVKVSISSEEIGRNGWFRYNTGTNATFRRDVLFQIGGFDEQFDYFLDESELCFRLQQAGHKIGYAPELYVRHEFARSHNRGGKFDYSWETIAKNTTYFIAAYSKRQGADLRSYVKQRMASERVAPLDAAAKEKSLSPDERDRHVASIWRGVEQGFLDFESWPRIRELSPAKVDFLPFPTARSYPQVTDSRSRLHICIISKEAPPFAGAGGVGTLYYHLASELLLMGHYVSFIVPSVEDRIHRQGRLTVFFTKLVEMNLPPMATNMAGNIQWSLSALSALANTVGRERRIDVVDSALWDTEALALALVEKQQRPPLVVRLVTPYVVSAESNQWDVPPETLSLFKTAEHRLVNSADAVIPISTCVASTMVERYGLKRDSRWKQAYCGIAYWPSFDVNQDYDAFPDLEQLSDETLRNKKMVLFVGRLERRKGIDLLLDATDSILKDPDVILVVAGRDTGEWTDKFRQKAEQLGKRAGKRIVVLGEVSDATREKLLARSYCLVFSSRYESFGLVPLEAFVHGTPVVASSHGAIPEVVLDGVCGLLYEGDNSAALAESVQSLLRDPELRARLSGGAKERVRQLSSRISAIHSVQVYDQLMREKLHLAKRG